MTRKILLLVSALILESAFASSSSSAPLGERAGDQAIVHEYVPGNLRFTKILFATNRSANEDLLRMASLGAPSLGSRKVDADLIFGNSISLGIRTGMTEISYPRDRLFGEQDYNNQDDELNFTVRYIRPQDDDTWIETITEGYSYAPVSAFGYLMFIHGFNTSFDYALRQAAQLKVDLDFKGPMLMFSWPSNIQTDDRWSNLFRYRDYYLEAGRRELTTVIHLSRVIDLLNGIRLDSATAESVQLGEQIISHSMGARLVLDTLNNIHKREKSMRSLNTLILAAANIKRTIFTDRDLPELTKYADKTLILCSQNDQALSFAKVSEMLAETRDYSEIEDGDGGEENEQLGQCVDYSDYLKAAIQAGTVVWLKFDGPRIDAWAHSYFINDQKMLTSIKRQVSSH
jgi:hypothetical protein